MGGLNGHNRHNVPFKIFGMTYDFHELFCECPPEAGDYYAGVRYYGPFNAADLKVVKVGKE